MIVFVVMDYSAGLRVYSMFEDAAYYAGRRIAELGRPGGWEWKFVSGDDIYIACNAEGYDLDEAPIIYQREVIM